MSKNSDPGWGCLLSLLSIFGTAILFVVVTFVGWVMETDHSEPYTEYAWQYLRGLWRAWRELW